MSLEAAVIAEQRCAFIKRWTDRAIALADDEASLRTTIPSLDRCTKVKEDIACLGNVERPGLPRYGSHR